MNTSEAKYTLTLVHPSKVINLKYHDLTTEAELATVILFVKDVFKAYLDTDQVEFSLDGEEITVEKILKHLDKEIQITSVDEIADDSDDKPVVIYINKKNQLIKISQKVVKSHDSSAGRDMRELHEILSFDINKLDHKDKHDIVSDRYANENLFKEPMPVIKASKFESDEEDEKKEVEMDTLDPGMGVPRVRQKVPIKDGVSQQKFYLDTVKRSPLMDDPNSNFFTLEEVAKHKTTSDWWTIWQGKVYDITTYIKSHPGGKKIMAGAGKDCTALFNKYHHWVNAHFMIGKLQVGVLKYK